MTMKASKAYIKRMAASLLTEGLEPGRAGMAVGLGIFIGAVLSACVFGRLHGGL